MSDMAVQWRCGYCQHSGLRSPAPEPAICPECERRTYTQQVKESAEAATSTEPTTFDETTIEELPLFLEHFREFSYLADVLGQDWFTSPKKGQLQQRARLLSQQALHQLLWEQGEMRERIRVAVIGDFSSGKSSFINSLLRQALCPVDVAAATSSITTFKYGDAEQIFLLHDADGSGLPSRQRLDRAEYERMVTHQGGTGQRYEFEIYYPFDGLRDVELYDTPGFNNCQNSDDERITLEKCRLADVIFFVLDINRGDLAADIRERVLVPLRDNSPDLPIYAIANRSDDKPPRKVAEICDTLRKEELFSGVVGYSSKQEMARWQEMYSAAIPEALADLLRQLQQPGNRYLITPTEAGLSLKPEQLPHTPGRQTIQTWLDQIQRCKQDMLLSRHRAELAHYRKQSLLLAYEVRLELKRFLRGCKINTKAYATSFKATLDDGIDENYFLNAVKASLSEGIRVSKINNSGVFYDDWEVGFYGAFFDKNIKKHTEKLIDNINTAVAKLPYCDESITKRQQELREIAIHFPNSIFREYKSNLSKVIEKNERHSNEHDARAFKASIIENSFHIKRGLNIFSDISRIGNEIAHKLDIFVAQRNGSASTKADTASHTLRRVERFIKHFPHTKNVGDQT